MFWPPEWDFLPHALNNFRGILMVVAPPDRGKTTLIRLLSSFFVSQGKKVGWVDSDLGQSNVGPPATVGMVMVSKKFPLSLRERLFTPYFRFVGDVTPEKRIEATALYTAELTKMASSKTQITLIDTCGLIFSLSGLRLKMLKMKLIKPELVLGIGRDEEFEVLKKFYGEQFWVVSPSSRASKKDYEKRRSHRERLFSLYFSSGENWEMGWENLRFFSPYHPYFFLQEYHLREGIPTFEFSNNFFLILSTSPEKKGDNKCRVINPSSLSFSICGLYTERGEELGLGVIQSINEEKKTIAIRGTKINPGKVEVLVPGVTKINAKSPDIEQ
ncbi:MAG TPA: Clp1/GlmU family protein [Candidatus Atribacteria bacterium]|nr:Clp1/GlmU family protein [Candidatus Atribacteria bacterium]